MNLHRLQTSNPQKRGEFSGDRSCNLEKRVKEESDGHSDCLSICNILSAGRHLGEMLITGWHPSQRLSERCIHTKWPHRSGETLPSRKKTSEVFSLLSTQNLSLRSLNTYATPTGEQWAWLRSSLSPSSPCRKCSKTHIKMFMKCFVYYTNKSSSAFLNIEVGMKTLFGN